MTNFYEGAVSGVALFDAASNILITDADNNTLYGVQSLLIQLLPQGHYKMFPLPGGYV